MIAEFPKEYEIEVHQIDHDMEEDPTKVTSKVLRTEIQARYARITELNGKKIKKKDEPALAAIMQYNDAALGVFLIK